MPDPQPLRSPDGAPWEWRERRPCAPIAAIVRFVSSFMCAVLSLLAAWTHITTHTTLIKSNRIEWNRIGVAFAFYTHTYTHTPR